MIAGQHSHKLSILLVLTMIVMSPCVKSSILRNGRSIVGHAAVGSAQIGISSSHQILNDWCANLTKYLNTTLEKFVSDTNCIRFYIKLYNVTTCNWSNFATANHNRRRLHNESVTELEENTLDYHHPGTLKNVTISLLVF